VSHVRRSVSAKEKALVRKLAFVKKNTHTSSITVDTASEAIAGGDNWPNPDQSTIVPHAPKRTWPLTNTQTRHAMAMSMPSGLMPRAFRRNPYVMLSLKSKSNFFPPSGRV
jgi:hypothetical protein